VVADVYRAKKGGQRPSEEQLRQGCAELRLYCQCLDSLRIGPDGLLNITLAATARHPDRKRVVCPAAIRLELVWDTHKQAHAGAQKVLHKLQLQWYWPNMERDVRLRVKRCEICQASKHGCFPGEAGRQAICWQTVATRSCRPGRTHARREHLDLSINRPLYAVGRRSNYSGRVCPHDGQGARSERVLLL